MTYLAGVVIPKDVDTFTKTCLAVRDRWECCPEAILTLAKRAMTDPTEIVPCEVQRMAAFIYGNRMS